MRLPINTFGNLQFLKGDFFNVSGSDSAISQRITFSSRIVLLKTNPVAKLVFEKMSKYTIETSKLPFLCLLKKPGCQRQCIRKTFLVEIFDIVSDFESRNLINLIRVKFNLNFAKVFSFWINSFTPHQISKTICFFFFTNQILKKTWLSKNWLLEPFYDEKPPKLAVLCFFHRMNLRKKTGMANSFWNQFFIRSESSNQQFHKSSVSEWIFLKRVGCWINIFATHQVIK